MSNLDLPNGQINSPIDKLPTVVQKIHPRDFFNHFHMASAVAWTPNVLRTLQVIIDDALEKLRRPVSGISQAKGYSSARRFAVAES